MQCEMLSEFPHPVLPLPYYVYISVTSLWLDQRVIDTAVRPVAYPCAGICENWHL